MPFGECRHPDAEIAGRADQPHQLVGMLKTLRMRRPLGAGIAGRIAAQGKQVADPDVRVGADHVP